MQYAPILIPTLNRYEHLKRCLESLSKCTWADQTEVFVSLDYPPSGQWDKYAPGWEKNRDFLRSCGNLGFKNLFVIEQKENLGVTSKNGKPSNYHVLYGVVADKYDRYILTEDDNVFSPAFLDFMNKSLEQYENDDKIVSVCGFNHDAFNDQGGCSHYMNVDSCAWGVGYWVRKNIITKDIVTNDGYFNDILHSPKKAKQILNLYPALYDMLQAMVSSNAYWGDVRRTAFNILEGCYQLRPAISLVKNIGCDGSGVHCGEAEDEQYVQETLDEALIFDMSKEAGPFETKHNYQSLYKQCLSSNEEKRQYQLNEIKRIYVKNISLKKRFRFYLEVHCPKLLNILLSIRTVKK